MLQQVTTTLAETPMASTSGPTRILAEFLARLTPEAVPVGAIEAAKVMVLDLLGCSLGAMRTAEVAMAGGVFETLGGNPECTPIGFRFRTSCQNAAYLNGISSHVIELDDTHRDSITHVGAPVIPAALAVAERTSASGLAFLLSVVAGYEACLRVANAVQPSHWKRGFLSMGTCGTFGAAAAAGNLLHLDADGLSDALGLAGIQAAGLNSSIYGEGDMGKRLCPGHAASMGLLSALLAERGFTGSRRVIEQRKGFCESFADEYDLSRVTDRLGETWEVMRTSLKPYSCCRYNHAAIDGLLDIMASGSVAEQDIAGITVRTYDIAVTNRPHRVQPHTLFDAKMSIPFSLAVAARKRSVAEHDFTEDLLADTSLQDFAGQVRVEADAAMTAAFPREWPAEVQVRLRDGRMLARHVPYPKGEPEAPMSQDEVETKFRDLAHVAITSEAASEVITLVRGLDQASGVASLMQAITRGLKN